MVTWRDPIYLAAGITGALLRLVTRQTAPAPTKTTPPETTSELHFTGARSWIETTDEVLAGIGPAVYGEMVRDDAEVANGLEELVASVVSIPWTVKPGAENATSRKAAEFCERALRAIGAENRRVIQTPETAFEELLTNALQHGWTLAEKVWTQTRDGHIWLDYLAFRPVSEWVIHVDDAGLIESYEYQGPGDYGHRMQPDRMLVMSYAARLGQWLGQSRLRRVYRAYVIRKLAMKLHGIWLQKAASGALMGRMPKTDWINKDYRDKFLAAIQKINAETASVIPQEWAVDALDVAQQAGDAYVAALERYAKEIRIGLLGSTLATDVGDTGSRAVAEVHADTRETRVRMLRELEAATINKQLIEPICLLNFDASKPSFAFPVFARAADAALDLDAEAERLVRLYNIGFAFDPAEVAEKFGWTYKGQAEVLERSPTGKELPDGIGVFAAPDRYRVELAAKDSGEMDALEERALAAIYPLWSAAVKRLMDDPAQAESGGKLPGAEERARAFREFLPDAAAIGVRAIAEHKREPRKLARAEFAGWDFGEFVPQVELDEMMNLVTGRYMETFDGLFGEEAKRIYTEGLAAGKSMPEIAAEFAKAAGIDPNEPGTGKRYGEHNWALRREIRTAHTEMANRARFRAGAQAAWVEGWEYSAIMDNRTTPFCIEHNGMFFRKDDPYAIAIMPPNHYHCRSMMIPIDASEAGGKWAAKSDFQTAPDDGFEEKGYAA